MPEFVLRRLCVTWKMVLKKPLARQLYQPAIGMANALDRLGRTALYGLPPEQSKRATSFAFEILRGLRDHLEAEQQTLAGLSVPQVADFPSELRKELTLCHPNALQVLHLLTSLDRLARTWYDLWFLGRLTQEDLVLWGRTWQRRFQQAARRIHNLLASSAIATSRRGQPPAAASAGSS